MGISNIQHTPKELRTNTYCFKAKMPLLFLYYFICVLFTISTAMAEHNSTRQEKQLSVFTVVKFPNDMCTSATSGRNGTCYTSSECNSKGGSSSGSCASSFGVCCIFEKSCQDGPGSSVSENCTYFTSTARTAGASCSLTVCKSNSDVCQLRLDFESFTLSEAFTSTANTIGTYPIPLPIGVCTTDFFAISVPGGKAPPIICGENTGYHMYVPASAACNAMTAFFGTGTTTTTSAFTIKITQIKCNAKNKAPDQCLQYFTTTSGTFESFNYNAGAGRHLANQDYCYCFRAERTTCTICYDAGGNANMLGLGGNNAAAINLVDTSCGYAYGHKVGPADTSYSVYDHIVIPNGQCPITTAGTTPTSPNDRWCGIRFNCIAGPAQDGTAGLLTVCTSTKPFQFCLKTDGTESYDNNQPLTEVAGTGEGTRGFQMRFWQSTACMMKGFKHN